jgi:hypothetical protein
MMLQHPHATLWLSVLGAILFIAGVIAAWLQQGLWNADRYQSKAKRLRLDLKWRAFTDYLTMALLLLLLAIIIVGPV